MKSILFALCALLLLAVPVFADNEENYEPADQSLLLLPTAYTMPKGTSALTNYELAVFQYAYALSDRLHLSAAMVFPIHKEVFKTFSAGIKLNYLQIDQLQSSLNFAVNPHFRVMNLGNTISYGSAKTNLHLNVGLVLNEDSVLEDIDGDYIYYGGLGFIDNVSKRTAVIVEYALGAGNDDSDAESIVALGLRFKGQRISWDLGAIRPVSADMDDFIALPFIKATVMF